MRLADERVQPVQPVQCMALLRSQPRWCPADWR